MWRKSLRLEGRSAVRVFMLETFFLIYGVMIVAGSWLMLNGVAEAPLGYEDEDGFHYAPARVEEDRYDSLNGR